MARFQCESRLYMRPCFQTRTLSLSIHHKWHEPYEDVELPPMVEEFIFARLSSKAPAEIFRELRETPEGKSVTRNQVYYLWQKENAKIWKRDADPLKSAKILLSENDRYGGLFDEFASGNVRALSFFAPEAVRLARSVTQLVMDSTYGTNNAGMDLFAVLAEIDGTGLPLAYCLLDVVKSPNESGKLRADLGAKTDVLKQFLQRLKGLEFNPRCFAIDKDQAEISAVRSVWPEAKIQLCYWHVKRAVNKKMCESKKTKTQDHYWP